MKKNFLVIPGLIALLTIVVFSCKKKSDTGTGPGYKEENGTGLNPFPNNPTVTGTPTSTNPATQNSQIVVGGANQIWSNLSCASTSSISLKSVNGLIDVTLKFVSPPATGVYAIGPIPTPNQVCSMEVNNAPNQPAGTVWYGKSGMISVTTTSAAIGATITTNVICVQQNFNFPQVSVSGNMGCN